MVDEFKRLHAAVVEQTASRKTLASFVPQQLADRLAAHPETAIEPQEVEVSVLFSDIRGFSALAERLSARDVAEVVGKHLSAMAGGRPVARRHDRQVPGRRGDGRLRGAGAYLGPRGARIVVRDRDAGTPGGAERRGVGPRCPELGVGIGVNTGSVIAGTVGGGGRLEYTVVGDAVNIAQRLQSEAGGRRGRRLRLDDRGRAGDRVRVDRSASREGPRGAGGGVPCRHRLRLSVGDLRAGPGWSSEAPSSA